VAATIPASARKSGSSLASDLKRVIPDVAVVARDLYGIAFKKNLAQCPFRQNHNHGDRDPSLRHDRKRNRLFCASQQCFGEKGVDAIGLVRHMDHCSFDAAMQKLTAQYGIRNGGEKAAERRDVRHGNVPEVPAQQPILSETVRQGLLSKGYRVIKEFYYGANIRNVRFEHESRRQNGKNRPAKEFRWEHLDDGAWYSGDGGIPKPLYVNRLFRERDQVGLAVGFEGEAKADLAGEFGFAAFSFKNITPDQAATLMGCDVLLWPDNDASGRHQADGAAQVILDSAQARSIKLLTLPSDFPPAGDIIDAVNDLKWDRLRVGQLLETAVCFAGAGSSAPSGSAEGWPKPEPLQGDLPRVQAFSDQLLPESFRPFVRDLADRMQVPMDFPAVVLVISLAGAVNRRARIQPKTNDSSFVVVPNLWGGIVAPPGYLKSPVIQAGTRSLNQIQNLWRVEHERNLSDYALIEEEYELRKAGWREEYKRTSKKGLSAPPRPSDATAPPRLRRLIVNDATFEAMHETMSENPAGIVVIRDELTGWWSTLDRPGREGERAFCLQAWNGDTGHTIDRIGRGTIHVPACCMSMLGGIQPGRLRSYLVDSIEDGPGNDGLIQRFQVLVWPDTPADWNYVDRPPDAEAASGATRIFRNLVDLDAEFPARFRFAPDAQELYIQWSSELEAKVRGDNLHPAFVSHLSKYRSLMPSLALLFELADLASCDGFVGSSLADSQNLVSLEHARQAAAWCEYLETHAQRIYSCVVTPQLRAAGELAEHIRKKHIRNREGGSDWFVARDVYLKGWTGLDSPEAVRAAAAVLADAFWVHEIRVDSGASGGRPSIRYAVNPRVWE
jgi:putative DNA primase/helicase